MSEAQPDVRNAGLDIFASGGEMGERIRAFNWRETPLGPIEGWPQALKTTLRLMLDSRYPMFVWWGRALTIFYNDAYISIPGKRHPAALGQPASKVWAEVWDTLGPQADQVLNGGRATWNAELPLILERNGFAEEVFFTFSYSPIPDDRGGIGGVFCACSEDTERVLGERRLAALRQLAGATADAKTAEAACGLAAMILEEYSHDISFALIYLIDPDGRHARLVSRAGIASGGPIAPIEVGVEHPETLTTGLWSVHQAIAGGKVKVTDLHRRAELPGGPWPEPTSTAMLLPLTKGSQERPMGFLIVGASPRLEFDDKYEGFFELVAGSLARAVANARAYEEERKRAEALAELDRAKTEFFSNVSHEFRTPLTLMLGPLEGLLERGTQPLPEDVRETLSLAHRNGQRLLRLVNTLLDFSRIEAGRIQASYEPADLAVLTVELASVFRSAIEKAGLRLIVECPPLPEPAYVDREMWEKIVLNLLSNAFKFTFAGEIKVLLRWCGERIELSVCDTGVGIPEQELSRVFDRFHQVRGSRSRTHEGTGIGLSLVQELAHLHGGEVQVHSREHQGTTFIVSIQTGKAHLPAERITAPRQTSSTRAIATAFAEEAMRWLPGFESEAGAEQEVRTYGPSPEVESPQHVFPWGTAGAEVGPARILLADDNADMREYVSRLLAERYVVEAVSDGQAALTAACERPPDLVLTDVMMPRLGGFALLRELRARESTRAIPIIMLSARAGQEALVEGLSSGADDYLIKPFSAGELTARVNAHLEMARLRRESAEREQRLRREAESARAQVEAILQSITDGFEVLDAEWRFTYLNATARRRIGSLSMAPEELIGKCIWDIFPESRGSNLEREYRRAITERVPVHFKYFHPIERRWYAIRAYPVEEGGLSVYFQDITEHRQAEEELELSRKRYASLVTSITSIVWVAGPNGEFVDAQPEWEDFTGQSRAEYQDLNWIAALHPDDRNEVKQAWVDACEKHTLFRCRGRIWHAATNEYRYFLSQAVPLLSPDGSVYEWIGSLTDVHARSTAELALAQAKEQLQQHADNLEKTVAERTAMLQEAVAELEGFSYSITHDMRAPLRAMEGFSRILELEYGPRLDELGQDYLRRIAVSACRLDALIEDVLNYSKILRQELTLSPVNVEQLVEEILATYPNLQPPKVEIKLEGPFCPVLASFAALTQVISNLLSNAVKFVPAGVKPIIRVRTEQRSNDLIRIWFEDNGIGISPEAQQRIFGMFQCLNPPDHYEGTGIGLTIVRKAVERMGGTVGVESQLGQGSRFWVELKQCVPP
jgi:PAS domain S-box-containing protein